MPSTADMGDDGVPPDLVIGGHYRVLRLLGRGGMGAVFEAEHTWTKRRVAVKVMRPEVAARDDQARRFMQEAQAATKLAHPNIVDVLDMGKDAGLDALYIVQEFLTGRDLRDHLKIVRRMAPRDALGAIVPVMEALVVAHAHGIVHRDIKPDNIFLAETPRGIVPTLIDFGIAKVVDDDGSSSQRTTTGVLIGTPYYMAPEQGRGDTSLDARADVWSIGVVLYEALAGVRPASAANANALIAKIIYEDPVALDVAAPDVPADLVAAVMGALQRDLARRHPSMQAFLDALLACEATRGAGLSTARELAQPASGVGAPNPFVNAATVQSTLAPRIETLPSTGLPQRPGHVRLVAALALLAVVALGVIAAVMVVTRGPSPIARPGVSAAIAQPAAQPPAAQPPAAQPPAAQPPATQPVAQPLAEQPAVQPPATQEVTPSAVATGDRAADRRRRNRTSQRPAGTDHNSTGVLNLPP